MVIVLSLFAFAVLWVILIIIFGSFNYLWDRVPVFKALAWAFFIYSLVNAAYWAWTGGPMFFEG